jgi:hypothetical protein
LLDGAFETWDRGWRAGWVLLLLLRIAELDGRNPWVCGSQALDAI